MFDKLKSVIKTPTIEFLCQKEDFNVIPSPIPARKYMPVWYKNLTPKVDGQNKLENSTIKRCPPFLDAMTLGWIIPLAADVEFITNSDAGGVTYKSLFYKPMVENHTAAQIGDKEHPHSPKPPMKFLSYWAIKVPPGWSVLFMPPMNRPDFRFECIAGMVDCDGYFEYINFPFFFLEKNYTGIIKAGTPLVQAIPIKRDHIMTKSKIGEFKKEDYEELELTRRKRKSHESHYRTNVWSPK